MTELTKNFTLEELSISTHRGMDNTPARGAKLNLLRTAHLLEEVRALLGVPLIVTSGYRSNLINTLVGGSQNSRHKIGLAADFIAPKFGNPLYVCKKIAESDIQFDQLIHEYEKWIHIGLSPADEIPRREVLSITSAKKGYMKGL